MRLFHSFSLSSPPLFSFSALLLFSFFSGCSDRRAEPPAPAEEPALSASPAPAVEEKAFKDLKPSDVLVSVDGETLTKQGLEDRVEMEVKMRKYRQPGLSKEVLAAFRNRKIKGGVDQFVGRTLLYLYAKDAGIRPTDQELRAFEKRFEKVVQGKAKGRTLEKLFETLGEYHAGLLREEIRRDAVVDVCKNRLWAEELRIPEAEIDRTIKNIALYNERAEKTNELVFARATNVWNRLKAGEPFDALADSFSEEEQKQPGGYWGVFTLKELPDDEELIRAVKTMKPGAFTPPIEADGGLMIVKLLEIGVSDDEPEIPMMAPPPTYKLAYIFFRLPIFYETATCEEIRKAKVIARQAVLYEKLKPALMKGRSIRYPNGKNLFPAAPRRGGKKASAGGATPPIEKKEEKK